MEREREIARGGGDGGGCGVAGSARKGAGGGVYGHIVKYLPGFDGELPFKLETGYTSVDETEFFYYFVESEGNPEVDPLLLWLTGGLTCSAYSGLMFEVGPMEFDVENYTGGSLKLRYYPHGWTKVASMIFLDSPVGTGFSYARSAGGWYTSDVKSSEQAYQFVMKWLVDHPHSPSVELFIAGESYAGVHVPLITKMIIDGNKEDSKPYMNIKGYFVGSPQTDQFIDKNSKFELAHRLALISDEIYENAKRSCKGNYVNVDPENTECLAAVDEMKMCVKDVTESNVLKPTCEFSSPHRQGPHRRDLVADASEFPLSPSVAPNSWCSVIQLTHSEIWGNDESVREALHIWKGTVPHWQRCNHSISYTQDVSSVVSVHKELSRLPLEVLVQSGDHDMMVTYTGTLRWMKSLNLTMTEDWRPWYVDDQVAAYVSKYSENGHHLTFATRCKMQISQIWAGHPATEYTRKECCLMFDRWIHHQAI
ncbi:hypothetical protein NMG60_11019823 [Bertholletia excelsa]